MPLNTSSVYLSKARITKAAPHQAAQPYFLLIQRLDFLCGLSVAAGVAASAGIAAAGVVAAVAATVVAVKKKDGEDN